MPKHLWTVALLFATAFGCTFSHGCVDETNFLTTDRAPVKVFIVFDSQLKPLWKLSSSGSVSAKKVRYGVVPPGFVQEVPARGARPRPLVTGEEIVVVVVSPTDAFRHEGMATGPAKFLGGYWEAAPLRERTLERALRGEKITEPV
jgi:hypothetical protein